MGGGDGLLLRPAGRPRRPRQGRTRPRLRPRRPARGARHRRCTDRRDPVTDIRARALEALAAQTIELPSWAFGNSGTRFKVFGQPGVARDPFEKLEDAAQVHKYTGVAPRVSLHIPWDKVDDFGKLAAHASDLGVRLGGITRTCSRTTTTGWARSPIPTRRSGAR